MSGRRKRSRANGEGWIFKRKDGRYDVGLHVITPDGKVNRRATTKKDRVEADRWLTAQKSNRDGGVILSNENPPLGTYLESWLEDAVRGSVKDATFIHYQRMVHNHIIPDLGNVKIKSLSARHIQRLYARKRDEGYAVSTRRQIHTTLRKALSQAVAYKDIPSDPSASVTPPPLPTSDTTERIKPYSKAQLSALFAAAKHSRLYALYRLAPTSGLREQELCALSWPDLELPSGGAGTVRVRQAVVQKESGVAIEGVKTRNARRTVEIPAGVVADLREHRKRQNEERLASNTWNDRDLVFTNAHGMMVTRYRLGVYFRKLRADAGISSEHHFADFRHTFATLMFARNKHPKLVQQAMGHGSIKVTMDTYSAYIPEAHQGYSDALEDIL